ncbi:MAG: hypothetical protein WCP21_10360, partial [Armatimonadota bacterium]
MLIATFGPTTEWVGRTITCEGGVFTLEGHGPITAADVMEHDRQGHLTWAYDGLREWVEGLISGPPAAPPVPQPATPQVPVSVKAPPQMQPFGIPMPLSQSGSASAASSKRRGAPPWVWAVIGGVLLAVVVAVVMVNASMTKSTSSLTPTERTQLAFFVEHAPQLRSVITDTEAVIDSGITDVSYVADAMGPVTDNYVQLQEEYLATSGGERVGGALAHLEALWESCATDTGIAAKTILECYTNPDTVDAASG